MLLKFDAVALDIFHLILEVPKKNTTSHDISKKVRQLVFDKCGSYAYCITEEGEPYYCAMQNLYAFVKLSDNACPDFVSKEKVDD